METPYAPLISVVMVSYFTGSDLDATIRSVLSQNIPIELILVDNGNTPDRVLTLQKLARDEPRFHLITGGGNIGFSRACNRGAREAKGQYFLFMNPDSLLPHNAGAHLVGVASALKPPFLLGARLLNEEGRDQRGCRRALLTPKTAVIEALHLYTFFPKDRLNFTEDALPNALSPIPALSGAFMFLRAIDFWMIEGFDEGYFLHVEDLDFCWRFRAAGGVIYFDPFLKVTHIGGTSRATKAFIEKCKARGFIRYFKNNFGSTTSKPLLFALYGAIWLRAGVKIILQVIGL